MKKICFFLIMLLFFMLQATLFQPFRVFGVKPDLLLLSAVSAGLLFDLKWALFFGIIAGFLKDILGVQDFAFNVAFFSLWSYVSHLVSRKVHLDNELFAAIFVCVVAFAHIGISRIVFTFLGITTGSTGVFARTLLLEPLYTALFLPPAYRVFARLT
ncbi:MAG: rod shape-determining protein MreD [Candidatus Omnitrophica bacterium]|nr:rod shape-determining protein MreD [Candidatus Omnitrophota bacterium]